MQTSNTACSIDFETALEALERLRQLVEKNYRESQETGQLGRTHMALAQFRMRSSSIRGAQPEAFTEWMKGNARFFQAVQEGRNPVLC